MGTASDTPATENACVVVAQHAGAGAKVRSRAGYFPKRISLVLADKTLQKRSREHSFVVGLPSGMLPGNTCSWLFVHGLHGILCWLVPILALLSLSCFLFSADALCGFSVVLHSRESCGIL